MSHINIYPRAWFAQTVPEVPTVVIPGTIYKLGCISLSSIAVLLLIADSDSISTKSVSRPGICHMARAICCMTLCNWTLPIFGIPGREIHIVTTFCTCIRTGNAATAAGQAGCAPQAQNTCCLEYRHQIACLKQGALWSTLLLPPRSCTLDH